MVNWFSWDVPIDDAVNIALKLYEYDRRLIAEWLDPELKEED